MHFLKEGNTYVGFFRDAQYAKEGCGGEKM